MLASRLSRLKAALTPDEAAVAAHVADYPVYVARRSKVERMQADLASRVLFLAMEACAADTKAHDFDDMVWMPLIYGLPLLAAENVLVDELQDFTPAQIAFTRALARERVVAVYDGHQRIYGFRGAVSGAADKLVEGAASQVTRLPLTVTFRCPLSVVREAQEYVPTFEARPGAPEGKVEHVDLEEFYESVRPGDLVLSRTRAPLVQAALDLKDQGVPTFRLGANANSELLGLIRLADTESITGLQRWIRDFRSVAEGDQDPDTGDNLDALMALTMEATSVQEVRDAIRRAAENDVLEKSVVLSTVHAAKGREARRVFIFWNTFHQRDSEEEDNLAYVAITRAKEELYFVDGLPTDGVER